MFNKDNQKKSGLTSWCKECQNTQSKTYNNDGHYSVYILVNEHYAGKTKALEQRLRNHIYQGKDISNVKIFYTCKTNKKARLIEDKLHNMGFYGKKSSKPITKCAI